MKAIEYHHSCDKLIRDRFMEINRIAGTDMSEVELKTDVGFNKACRNNGWECKTSGGIAKRIKKGGFHIFECR